MQGLKQAKAKILAAKDIVIASHINPDGDSIGSLLSLGLGLKKLGKRVCLVSNDGVPKRYLSLPGAKEVVKNTNKSFALAIAIDCSNKEILGNSFKIFEKSGDILEIDHHEFRRPFGNARFIDHKAAAVGELVYLLLRELKIRIDKEIAQNILTSIIVETNSFSLPNIRPFTFELCEKLLETGLDFYKLVDTVFWAKTKEEIILSGTCLSRCKFLNNGAIAWSVIRKADFHRLHGKDYDVDRVADQMRSVKGVKIAILFREKNREFFRVSLRSKGEINVASLAEKYKGGGHFDIAGCDIPNNAKAMEGFLKQAKDLLRTY